MSRPFRIAWKGSVTALHSLAIVNRHLCRRLLERGHEIALISPPAPEDELPLEPEIAARVSKALSGPADLTIAHQWPPDFRTPAEGHWIVMQPWEFGSLPRSWIGPMTHQVDEVWVPTSFVRDCFVKSGIPAEQVKVIPHGVSPR